MPCQHIYLTTKRLPVIIGLIIDKPRVQRLIKELLVLLGENPKREGLVETPKRVATAWEKILEGYSRDFKSEIKVFENSSGYDGIITSGNIEFFSTCEHHLLPFYGHAFIGYIPGKNYCRFKQIIESGGYIFEAASRPRENYYSSCRGDYEGIKTQRSGCITASKTFL